MLDVGCWMDVGWMDVGWLEKVELKPTQPSLAGDWLSLAKLRKWKGLTKDFHKY